MGREKHRDQIGGGNPVQRNIVLETYDRMAAAIARGGTGWESLAGVLAGDGPGVSHTDAESGE